MKTATVPDIHTRLQRKNKRTGHTETVVYTGHLRLKPKGWRVCRDQRGLR